MIPGLRGNIQVPFSFPIPIFISLDGEESEQQLKNAIRAGILFKDYRSDTEEVFPD